MTAQPVLLSAKVTFCAQSLHVVPRKLCLMGKEAFRYKSPAHLCAGSKLSPRWRKSALPTLSQVNPWDLRPRGTRFLPIASHLLHKETATILSQSRDRDASHCPLRKEKQTQPSGSEDKKNTPLRFAWKCFEHRDVHNSSRHPSPLLLNP